MCGGALGSGGAGSTPFGSGSLLAIDAARQSTLNSVDVTFNVVPRATDPGDIRDALNPANWSITPIDPPTARDRLTQTCVRLSADVVRVYVDGFLDPFVTYRIEVSADVEALGGGAMSSCSTSLFETFGWPRETRPAAALDTDAVDLANPFVQSDAPTPTAPLGTFQIDEQGDIANDANRQNLRKRVLRRATSIQGSFFHLAGYGFGQKIKGNIGTDLLRRIQNAAIGQIRQEPDVVDVSVRASSPVPNIVRLLIRVEDRYGRSEEIVADVRLDPSGSLSS